MQTQQLKIETTNHPVRSNNKDLNIELHGDVYVIVLNLGDKCSFPVINEEPILINNEPHEVIEVDGTLIPLLPHSIDHTVAGNKENIILTIRHMHDMKKLN